MITMWAAAIYATPQFETSESSGDVTVVVEQQNSQPAQDIEAELAGIVVNDFGLPVTIRTKKGHEFTFPYINESEVTLIDETTSQTYLKKVSDEYFKMDDELQAKFHKKRIMLLSLVTRMLIKTELAAGVWVITKNKYYGIKKMFNRGPPNAIPEVINADLACEPTTCRAKGQAVVSNILKKFDQQLWLSAPVVATQNEFSGFGSIAIVAESGVLKKGYGGSFGMGFTFGYNSQTQAIVFEITLDTDKFKEAYTPFLTAGITPKLGISINNFASGTTVKNRESSTINFPVAPTFASKGTRGVSMGVNPSITSFPPTPIGDLFSFLNQSVKRPVIRLTFSNLNTYFISFGSSLIGKEWGVPNAEVSVAEHSNRIIRIVKKMTNKCMSSLGR